MMDSLIGLTSFVHTAEALSFTGAGRTLGISASAVGKNVARLEAQLGVRLLNRSTRSVSLTPEGELLLARSRHILEQLREAEAELSSVAGNPSGKLKISVPAVGYHLLFPLMAAFSEQYPDIVTELDFSDRFVSLTDEGFDVAIRSGKNADSRLASRTLGGFRFLLCASPGYIALHGQPSTPNELYCHKCLYYRFAATGLIQPWELTSLTLTGQHPTSPPETVNNIEALVTAVTCGMGICYVPDFVVKNRLKRGELVEILTGSCHKQGSFSALWPHSRFLSPRIRCFIDFLRDNWHFQ